MPAEAQREIVCGGHEPLDRRVGTCVVKVVHAASAQQIHDRPGYRVLVFGDLDVIVQTGLTRTTADLLVPALVPGPLGFKDQLIVRGRHEGRLVPRLATQGHPQVARGRIAECVGPAVEPDKEVELVVHDPAEQLEHANEVALAGTIGSDQYVDPAEIDRR